METISIILYAIVCLTLLAIACAWVDTRNSNEETDYTNSGDVNDYEPEPPEPTTPSHGPLPDIEPDEVQGTPYLPALPLWANDNKEAVARADVALFRERSLGNMRRVA